MTSQRGESRRSIANLNLDVVVREKCCCRAPLNLKHRRCCERKTVLPCSAQFMFAVPWWGRGMSRSWWCRAYNTKRRSISNDGKHVCNLYFGSDSPCLPRHLQLSTETGKASSGMALASWLLACCTSSAIVEWVLLKSPHHSLPCQSWMAAAPDHNFNSKTKKFSRFSVISNFAAHT